MSSMGGFFEQLGELDQNNIGSWPTWAHAGALIIVMAIILAAGTWYFVRPKQDALKRLQRQEIELKHDFVNEHKQVASLAQYREQLAQMREQFRELLDTLPTKAEMPNLLNDISKIRLSSGLQETLFKPRPPIRKQLYVILPNAMTVTGKYHELAEFVSRVASLPRIVTIDHIGIKPVDGGPSGELAMNMIITTYRYTGANDTKNKSGYP